MLNANANAKFKFKVPFNCFVIYLESRPKLLSFGKEIHLKSKKIVWKPQNIVNT